MVSHVFKLEVWQGVKEVIKLLSCSIRWRLKFHLFINTGIFKANSNLKVFVRILLFFFFFGV